MHDAIDALVERGAGAEREHQKRNDEAPEIKFAAIAEWVRGIGRTARLQQAVKQQELIARIDTGMERFAEHRRRPRPPSGGELSRGNEPIAGERRVDNLIRGYRHDRLRRSD